MSLSRVGLSVLRGVRQSSSVSNVHPGYGKIKTIAEKFGVEDSTPVFKRGGALDNVIYGATFIICATGVGISLKLYYECSLR